MSLIPLGAIIIYILTADDDSDFSDIIRSIRSEIPDDIKQENIRRALCESIVWTIVAVLAIGTWVIMFNIAWGENMYNHDTRMYLWEKNILTKYWYVECFLASWASVGMSIASWHFLDVYKEPVFGKVEEKS